MKTENDRLYFRLLSGVVRHSSESEVNDALLQIDKKIKQRRILRNMRIKVAVSTMAASFLLALILGNAVQYYQRQNELVSLDNSAGKDVKQFVLPDGTTVFLNAGGTFRYKERMFRTEREVHVAGEAWFDVTKDDLHPFIVKTDGANVKVLGTSFSIKSGRTIQVVLERGRVELSNRSGEILAMMSPGQKAVVSAEEGKLLSIQTVDPYLYSRWKNPFKIYDSIPFSGIITLIENKFNVKIQYDTKDFRDTECRFVMYENHSLEDVMQILSTIIPMEYSFVTDNLVSVKRSHN